MVTPAHDNPLESLAGTAERGTFHSEETDFCVLRVKARRQVVPPTSLEGIEKYLGSGMVKGIGPHFAQKLVRAFGEAVFDVIESAPERLTELEGIGPKRQQRVVEAWAEQKVSALS